jgi:hypothetical protein
MKYTDELKEEIFKLISEGNTYKDTCLLLNISQSQFIEWKNGNLPEHIKNKDEFNELVKKADAEFKKSLIGVIKKDKSWQSKAWLLERKFPEDFSEKIVNQIVGKDGQEFVFKVQRVLTDEEKKLLELKEKEQKLLEDKREK